MIPISKTDSRPRCEHTRMNTGTYDCRRLGTVAYGYGERTIYSCAQHARMFDREGWKRQAPKEEPVAKRQTAVDQSAEVRGARLVLDAVYREAQRLSEVCLRVGTLSQAGATYAVFSFDGSLNLWAATNTAINLHPDLPGTPAERLGEVILKRAMAHVAAKAPTSPAQPRSEVTS